MNAPPDTATSILVVDDQPGVRLTLKGILERKGYPVSVAEDGLQAIELVKKNSYRVIFMDIKMPGLSGVETFLQIKEYAPHTTVIMMTAFAMEEEIKTAIREGAYAVLHKPLDIDRILLLLAECIENKTLVLLVDDQMEDRELLKISLEKKGYKVAAVENSDQCIRELQERRYQIVLMDYRMPGVDGIETLKQVKKVRPDAVVIMMSAYTSEQLVERALEEGSIAFIQKPLDVKQLMLAIDKSIGPQKDDPRK